MQTISFTAINCLLEATVLIAAKLNSFVPNWVSIKVAPIEALEDPAIDQQ